jgi:hypothetical protein
MCNFRVDALAGLRYMHLRESLSITESLTSTNPAGTVPVGSTVTVTDLFRTQNNYYGGQIGLTGEVRVGRVVGGFRALWGLGEIHRDVLVAGTTGLTVPGQLPVTSPGGVLALPSNSTHSLSDQLAFASEYDASVGYQITDHVKVSVGYALFYLTHAVRPGGQIDTTVDPSQFPPAVGTTTGRPQFALHTTNFWLQGVSFGVELRY